MSDISSVRKNYIAKIEKATKEDIIIELIPKKPTPEIASIDIGISKQSYNIYRVITRKADNNTNTFNFTQVRFETIDPDLFEFVPPKGVATMEWIQ